MNFKCHNYSVKFRGSIFLQQNTLSCEEILECQILKISVYYKVNINLENVISRQLLTLK